MATCESLEQEIRRLQGEAAGLRKRIEALETGAKNNNKNNNSGVKQGNENQSVDLTAIYRRLTSLESQTANHRQYIDSLEGGIKAFGNAIKKVFDLFKFFFSGIEDVDT